MTLRASGIGRDDVLARFDRQERIEAQFPGVDKQSFPNLVRFDQPGPATNFILYSRPDPESVLSVIDAQIEALEALEGPLDWKIYGHDQPPDLGAELLDHGFVPDEQVPVLILELDSLPRSLTRPHGQDVRRLDDPSELDHVVRVEEQVWDGDFSWIPGRFSREMRQPGYLEVFMAYVESQPASVGWTHFQGGSEFAGLWGGSTSPAFRRQGLYTAVLAERVMSAKKRGRRFVTVEAEPASERILRKHGFQELTTVITYTLERQ
jgi:ribosomal protein S18 acetylase RimI-like enzyme